MNTLAQHPTSIPAPATFSRLLWVSTGGFALFLLWVGTMRIAPPDLAYYYSYAHSLLYDLDYHFANQFSHFPFGIHETYLTRQAYPANDWPIGTGAAWIPFLLLARLVSLPLAALGVYDAPAGYGWLDQWIVTFGATLLYSWGTVILSYLFCRKEGLSQSDSLWASALMAAGSTYSYHLFVNSADSHPPSAFFIILYLWLWRQYQENPMTSTAILAGAALGISALIRPHNAVFLLTPLLQLLFAKADAMQAVRGFSIAAATAALAYLPQMALWKQLYGSWVAVPRSEEVLWTQPHLYEMLLSDFHGMISWSPLFGLGLLGLFTQKRWLAYAIPVLIQVYIYACNIAWWAGGSFGNRRMVAFVPLLILGLAGLFQAVQKPWIKFLAIVSAIWTLLLLLSEVGGRIALDHYQPWREILESVKSGALPGLIRLFLNREWAQHGEERLIGGIAVLIFLVLCLWLIQRYRIWLQARLMPVAIGFLLFFNVLSFIAMNRSEKALAEADVSQYSRYDRFTWVIYFEKGFYLLRNQRDFEAMETFAAATVVEPRHSQPWMYISTITYRQGWKLAAYQYAVAAVERGQKRPEFLEMFERMLTERILRESTGLHRLYNQRGVLRTIMQKYNEAESDFQMALTAQSGYAIAQENRKALQARRQGTSAPLMWE